MWRTNKMGEEVIRITVSCPVCGKVLFKSQGAKKK